MKAALSKLTLDNFHPRILLEQRAAFAKVRGLALKGCDVVCRLAARACWEKAVDEGLSHESLLYAPFLWKLVLHDVWFSHRRGQVMVPQSAVIFLWDSRLHVSV